MCCVKPAAYSTSRAHICGAGEAGLDRRVKPPPHVALTPRHGPQNYGSAGVSKKQYRYLPGMAERAGTSLRDTQIPDDDGARADEAASKYLMTARAEAVKILQPECRVYGTANRQTASLQFLCTKCMTRRSDLRTTFKSRQPFRSRTSSDRTLAQAAEPCAVGLLQKHQR